MGCKYIAIALIPGQPIETCPREEFAALPTQEQVAEIYKANPTAREVIVLVVSSHGETHAKNVTIEVMHDNQA